MKDLPTDIWTIVMTYLGKESHLLGIINKNATESLMRVKWNKLNSRTSLSITNVFKSGFYTYYDYVEELELYLKPTTTVHDIQWMQYLRKLKRVVIRSSEEYYSDATFDEQIMAFLSIVFKNNKGIKSISAGCQLLDLFNKATVDTITLLCTWTKKSAKVIKSFPVVRHLTLRKTLSEFYYYFPIPQVKSLVIEVSWLKQQDLLKMSKVFTNIKSLYIDHEFGSSMFDFSSFHSLSSLEVYHMAIVNYPVSLKSLKCYNTSLDVIDRVPIHTLQSCHISLLINHVSEFTIPQFHFLSSFLCQMQKLSHFSFACGDGHSQLILSNSLSHFYINRNDLTVYDVNNELQFAIFVDASIPAFLSFIGEKLIQALEYSQLVPHSASLDFKSLISDQFPIDEHVLNHSVLNDIKEMQLNGIGV